MAYTPLKISIPEPCHEDWNGMHPVPGTTARHCDSCAKNVVDFTGFSDAKMHAYVREQGGKLCGRFRPDQLNRPLRAVSTPTSNPLKVAAAAAGVMLAATGCETSGSATGTSAEQDPWQAISSSVQTHPPMTGGISLEEVEMATVGKIVPPPQPPQEWEVSAILGAPPELEAVPPPPPTSEVGEFNIEFMQPPLAFNDPEVLQGKPTVDTSEVKPFITCGPGKGESLIIEGGVEFLEEDVVGDIAWIEEGPDMINGHAAVSSPGEMTNSDTIPKPPPLPPSEPMPEVMGMIVMEYPRPTGIDWVKDTLKTVLPTLPTLPSEAPSLHQRPRPEMPRHLEALTVFPNPFVDHLTVEINLPAGEMLTVELLDPHGRLVFAQAWKAVAGANTLAIAPKQRKLTHAIYYLRVTDERQFSVVRTVVR